ncbi:Na+/H+ antiporter NhaC family protein [Paraglaciecola aquimarina]|uniref:Na+/H+ antiporter NhaC family protein n=1 Tax=Paraglaciecola algarum TaxID=3050085 RepID=A0ABS9D784_9ALTE|nr:Na+/H+ antiporter NhaC family protein [Paraglaciecola sp. G1-23]MCF2948770.1 Na+/H+ antiporter NhaC family protein [Paraglaciecola sp. G1-23]
MMSPSSNFLGLTPIFVFVALVVGSSAITQDFTTMPILVAFTLSTAYAFMLNSPNRQFSFAEKIEVFCKGGGDKTIILLGMIFLLAGAFYAVTIDIGARDATVNWALHYIPTAWLLPGLFVITCFIAFAMGTSMGTITAITPIGIGLAESLGLPISLVVGIVVGGAMFGDNLSFISDTTIAATQTQGVKLRDKFKANIYIVLPAALVTIILLMTVSLGGTIDITQNNYDLTLILPYIVIIVSALCGLHVISVLGVGIASACVIGLVKGIFTFPSMLKSIQTGMGWMQDMVAIALMIGGLVALMQAYGGLAWLIQSIQKRVKSAKGAEAGSAMLVSFLDVATANNTIAIVTAGPIAKNFSQSFEVDPKRTASILDIFSCGFQGLVPYGGQLLAAASLAGVSPFALTPYCWYPMLILLLGGISIFTGIPRFASSANNN